MVSFPNVESRLEHIRVTCGYPSQAALMDAIGRRPAQWGSWAARNNYGHGGDELLKETTGVSIDWLKSGKGEPFPNGPILWAGAVPATAGVADRIAKAEHDIDTLAAVVAQLLKYWVANSPAEARQILDALQAAQDADPRPPAFLAELIQTVKAAARGRAGGAARDPRKR